MFGGVGVRFDVSLHPSVGKYLQKSFSAISETWKLK